MPKNKSCVHLPVSIILSALLGIVITAAVSALLSAFIYFVLKDTAFIRPFSAVSVGIGCYTAAYINGHYKRHRGLLRGMLCSVIMYCILSAFSAVFGTFSFSIKKLLLFTVCGMTGGVYGVNSKSPDYKY